MLAFRSWLVPSCPQHFPKQVWCQVYSSAVTRSGPAFVLLVKWFSCSVLDDEFTRPGPIPEDGVATCRRVIGSRAPAAP